MKSSYSIPFSICLWLLLGGQLIAQSHQVSGFVKDIDSGEPLAGAYVMDSISGRACTSNGYGFFSLAVDSSWARLAISFVGYEKQKFDVRTSEEHGTVFSLKTDNTFEEVLVFGSRPINQVGGSSEIQLPMNLIREMPSFLGEPDLFKAIARLPGVQTGVEGTAGLHVRGGSPDQNLVLLNEVPLYNVDHLLGFFSVFNMDAIRSATFIKGGVPARYGGRLASVMDVKMKDGNLNEFEGTGSIGLLSSQIMVEGPVIKEKLGFMAAFRRTYSDLLYRPVLALASAVNAGYNFYDLNGSLYWNHNPRNSFYYSVYNGNDRGFMNEGENEDNQREVDLRWGNTAHVLRWNHIFGPRAFSNLSIAYTSYRYLNSQVNSEYDMNTELYYEAKNSYRTSIRDLMLKYHVEQKVGLRHEFQYGINGTLHYYKPGITEFSNELTAFDSVIVARNIQAMEMHIFAEDQIKLFDRLELNLGLHLSSFFVDDTAYVSPEPRISAAFRLGEKATIKASYSCLSQYVGLLTSTYVGLPTDLWIPTTRNIPSQQSDLFVLGYHHSLRWMNFSLEAYYREMTGLVEYKQGASYYLGRENWENLVATGTGEAYGLEFLAEKNLGRLSGWLAYTLSWNNRHFEGIDEDFPYKYDRRHNLSLSGVYHFSKRTAMSATWTYYTGENVTLSDSRYVSYRGLTTGFEHNIESNPGLSTTESFPGRNNLKMPAYHRLDLGMSIRKEKKNGIGTWRFGIYNVYNRQNTFFVMMYETPNKSIKLNRYCFTPFMPYVRYEFKF